MYIYIYICIYVDNLPPAECWSRLQSIAGPVVLSFFLFHCPKLVEKTSEFAELVWPCFAPDAYAERSSAYASLKVPREIRPTAVKLRCVRIPPVHRAQGRHFICGPRGCLGVCGLRLVCVSLGSLLVVVVLLGGPDGRGRRVGPGRLGRRFDCGRGCSAWSS